VSGFLHRDEVTPIPKAAERAPKPRRPLPRIGRKGRKAERELRRARKIVGKRSGGRCEVAQELWPHDCDGLAVHFHHVQRRSQGGPNADTNLLHICDTVHREIHEHPKTAGSAGLILLRGGAK
jgi:hypothetical protein